jgi:hypothetical protein
MSTHHLTPRGLEVLRSISAKPWQRYPTSSWGRVARQINTLRDLGYLTETVRVWTDERGLERRARFAEITPAGIAALHEARS